MNEPRRLSQSGGVSQRLLDSASLDKPSAEARRRAAGFAATASSFATTRSGAVATAPQPVNVVKTLATWICVGAAAGGLLALLGSRLFDGPGPTKPASAVLAELPPAASAVPSRTQDIAAEPSVVTPEPTVAATPPAPAQLGVAARAVEPWVPSLATNHNASPDEVREIEAARSAVARGDAAGAIASLDDYDHSHPNGELKPESMALRIQALSNSGRAAEARTLADDFERRYPTHALLRQVRAVE